MKKSLYSLLLAAIALVAVFSMTSCDAKSNENDVGSNRNNGNNNEQNQAFTPTPSLLSVPTDEIVTTDPNAPQPGKKVYTLLPWWASFCRFSANSTPIKSDDILADVATVGGGMHDEGIGPFFRNHVWEYGADKSVSIFDNFGIKKMAWIEGNGDTKSVIGGLHKYDDGTYMMDENTGAAKSISDHWGWANTGWGANPLCNEIVWYGQPTSLSKELWVGPYDIDDIPEPTYPDGSSAIGWFGEAKVPWEAKLYDACAASDLNGNWLRPDEFYEGNGDTTGKYPVELADGSIKYASDLTFGKDPAAPFWTDYNSNIGKFFMERGVDGFWVDNYNGWDSISNHPINKGFGKWSEYKFNEYLKDYPEIGITDFENFNIREYIKETILENNPDANVEDLTWGNNRTFMGDYWLTDKVWNAYKAFKSFEQGNASLGMYNNIKEAALNAGRNPDDIAMTGNDFCMMTNASMTGNEIDLVSTEYSATYSAVNGNNFIGLAPHGRSGSIYSLIVDYSKYRRANVWFYSHEYPHTANLGRVLGYEALAHNVTLNSGMEGPSFAGTDNSARRVNKSIGILKSIFANRDKYGDVGIFYSSNSEYSYLLPGGYHNGANLPTDIGYMGWAMALDDMNVPYITMQEYKVTEHINNVKVLIMPDVRSIDKDTVDSVLIPFLDNGNTIIVTGENAGAVATRNNNYMPNGSNLLEDLSVNYKGAGKVIFLKVDPACEYHSIRLKIERELLFDEYLPPMKDLIEGLIEEGRMNNILIADGFGDNFSATVNYDREIHSYFVDIASVEIDNETDEVPGNPGGKITVMLPEALSNGEVNVWIFTNDKNEIVWISSPDIKDGILTVDVPAFEIYASVIIEAK